MPKTKERLKIVIRVKCPGPVEGMPCKASGFFQKQNRKKKRCATCSIKRKYHQNAIRKKPTGDDDPYSERLLARQSLAKVQDIECVGNLLTASKMIDLMKNIPER